MKKLLSKLFVITLVFTLLSCDEWRHFIVTSRPAVPEYIRPMSPGVGYNWIEGEWLWNGRSYEWRNGFWSPPSNRYRWQPGEWKQKGNGYYWRQGHWRG